MNNSNVQRLLHEVNLLLNGEKNESICELINLSKDCQIHRKETLKMLKKLIIEKFTKKLESFDENIKKYECFNTPKREDGKVYRENINSKKLNITEVNEFTINARKQIIGDLRAISSSLKEIENISYLLCRAFFPINKNTFFLDRKVHFFEKITEKLIYKKIIQSFQGFENLLCYSLLIYKKINESIKDGSNVLLHENELEQNESDLKRKKTKKDCSNDLLHENESKKDDSNVLLHENGTIKDGSNVLLHENESEHNGSDLNCKKDESNVFDQISNLHDHTTISNTLLYDKVLLEINLSSIFNILKLFNLRKRSLKKSKEILIEYDISILKPKIYDFQYISRYFQNEKYVYPVKMQNQIERAVFNQLYSNINITDYLMGNIKEIYYIFTKGLLEVNLSKAFMTLLPQEIKAEELNVKIFKNVRNLIKECHSKVFEDNFNKYLENISESQKNCAELAKFVDMKMKEQIVFLDNKNTSDITTESMVLDSNDMTNKNTGDITTESMVLDNNDMTNKNTDDITTESMVLDNNHMSNKNTGDITTESMVKFDFYNGDTVIPEHTNNIFSDNNSLSHDETSQTVSEDDNLEITSGNIDMINANQSLSHGLNNELINDNQSLSHKMNSQLHNSVVDIVKEYLMIIVEIVDLSINPDLLLSELQQSLAFRLLKLRHLLLENTKIDFKSTISQLLINEYKFLSFFKRQDSENMVNMVKDTERSSKEFLLMKMCKWPSFKTEDIVFSEDHPIEKNKRDITVKMQQRKEKVFWCDALATVNAVVFDRQIRLSLFQYSIIKKIIEKGDDLKDSELKDDVKSSCNVVNERFGTFYCENLSIPRCYEQHFKALLNDIVIHHKNIYILNPNFIRRNFLSFENKLFSTNTRDDDDYSYNIHAFNQARISRFIKKVKNVCVKEILENFKDVDDLKPILEELQFKGVCEIKGDNIVFCV